MRYKEGLQRVIDYLEGREDIYATCQRAVEIWNEVWDEMIYLGHDPQSASGIRNYIAKEL